MSEKLDRFEQQKRENRDSRGKEYERRMNKREEKKRKERKKRESPQNIRVHIHNDYYALYVCIVSKVITGPRKNT